MSNIFIVSFKMVDVIYALEFSLQVTGSDFTLLKRLFTTTTGFNLSVPSTFDDNNTVSLSTFLSTGAVFLVKPHCLLWLQTKTQFSVVKVINIRWIRSSNYLKYLFIFNLSTKLSCFRQQLLILYKFS